MLLRTTAVTLKVGIHHDLISCTVRMENYGALICMYSLEHKLGKLWISLASRNFGLRAHPWRMKVAGPELPKMKQGTPYDPRSCTRAMRMFLFVH